MNSIVLVLSSLGIAQALFLCVYLLTLKKGNRKANLFLAFVLLGLTIRIGKSILNVYLVLEPWQRNLGISGVMMAGPFLWFYGRLLLGKEKGFSKHNYWHLLPFVLFVCFCFYIPNGSGAFPNASYLIAFSHLAVYLVLTIGLLVKYKRQANKSVWVWYRNMVIGVALLWIFYMGNLYGLIPYYIGGAIFFSFLLYAFSFLLLKRPVFAMEKYKNSSIDNSSSKKYMQQIRTLFETETLYLDSELNMTKVAQKLGIASRDVSQVINENEQQNFSEFVNHYRIAKAKDLLVDPSYAQEKIATVAYDCGFGNVTSFNLAFKAATQLTPSQYRNKFRLG
ncbi:helix-turn-helix transcriptional regulator [Maribacter algarum]|uniref:Helix-turn-helix transcriptional regulator n=1 Tax=Maribacter algarum (ex Zhang et al. 2020) TaxID=2578118 RepID=A0A5S3PV16_9FLAO|nr:AraC family transcriptional regulator [Maribacter algarum]TMM58790.1 helix-turn-helix transcriptional regulator [Maribacter algarum]